MSFSFKKLSIPDLVIVESKVFEDERGFFTEKYRKSEFQQQGLPDFIQDNYSHSRFGVIRGLHYQVSPHTQGKLVTVLKGRILDVAVDVRKNSKYFGKWVGIELSDDNNLSFFIPPGFAHGFVALSPEVCFLYKCTTEYNPLSERGIRWDDPDLNIDWKVINPIVSERDKKLPLLKEL